MNEWMKGDLPVAGSVLTSVATMTKPLWRENEVVRPHSLIQVIGLSEVPKLTHTISYSCAALDAFFGQTAVQLLTIARVEPTTICTVVQWASALATTPLRRPHFNKKNNYI